MTHPVPNVQTLRDFYNSGSTLSYGFRKKQLKLLLQCVLQYEDDIAKALYSDLKKSKEESWATETGLLVAEIKNAIGNLHKWMQPKKVAAGLVTFPSSAKIYCDPLGVVLIIAPWNYPLQLLLIPLVGAIAGGNCAILKPSELAPATEKFITKFIAEIFPDNYIKVITGSGAEVVPELINNFRFDHIFYTGSTTVGKEIYQLAAKDLVPVTLELGGKSPCIVYDDADIRVAAKRIVLGKFLNAGQTCIAPDYLLVHASVRDSLLAEIKTSIQKFYTGDPSSSNDYGKIINASRFKKLTGYFEGAIIFYGGKTNEETLFIEPTILTEVSLSDNIMKEEIFGPILPVISFTSTGEAMQIVMQNEKPLSFYLFTKNQSVEKEWLQKVSFGGGCVNNTVWHFANDKFPFGGIGKSGMGAYHGKNTFHLFTHAKPVLKTSTWIDPNLKYPPFTGKLKWFKKLIG